MIQQRQNPITFYITIPTQVSLRSSIGVHHVVLRRLILTIFCMEQQKVSRQKLQTHAIRVCMLAISVKPLTSLI